MEQRSIELEIETDVRMSDLDTLAEGYRWDGEGEHEGIAVEVRSLEGHGFGLTEVLTIVVSVGVGASANLLSDAIKLAVKGVIRRARVKAPSADSDDEVPNRSLEEALKEAIGGQSEAEGPHA
jgi:hypothetical protein